MTNRLFTLFLLLISSSHVYAQIFLKDIASSDASSSINGDLFNRNNYVIKGDTLFFLAQDTTMDNYQYRNVWFTNGTAANTKKVTHKNLTNMTVSYELLASFKGKVYYKDVTDRNLYATNGIDTTIVKTFANHVAIQASAIGDWLYVFVNNYQDDILELWKTDGTTINTTKVTDIITNFYGLNYSTFYNVGNRIYFTPTTTTQGAEPWVTDGTAMGTRILKDILPGSASSVGNGFERVGNLVFFQALDANSQWKLWKTDGTEAGTVMVANEIEGNSNYRPTKCISYDNQLYFTANTNKFYKTDGNTVTLVHTDLESFGNIVKMNNLMYFISRNGFEFELWKSNGTTAGTEKIRTILTSMDPYNTFARLMPGTSKLYFEMSYFHNHAFENITQHWVSDGTTAGTININTLNPNFSTGSFTNQLAVVGDTYYFTAFDAANGFELWKSNGTSVGTTLVKNINKGSASSDPSQFVALNNEVYFSADDVKYGREIWKTDGTPANTNLVMDYNAGINPNVNYYSIIKGMVPYNDIIIAYIGYQLVKFNQTMPPTAYFSQNLIDGKDPEFINFDNRVFYKGYDSGNGGYELFATDGNTAYKVKDLSTSWDGGDPSNFFVWNGVLYFATDQNTRIWKSDGTEGGTVLVKQLPTGSVQSKFYAVNGLLFFVSRNANYETKLWKTDGTESGTVLVKDFNTGYGGDGVGNLVVFNNMLFFNAYDGASSHLYKTDGSSANTQIIGSINSYNVPVVFKNKLFYLSADNTWSPVYLWSTDGISAPVKVKKLADAMHDASGKLLKNIDDNVLVFDIVPNYSRHELWASDGTAAGTKMVKLIRDKQYNDYYVRIKEYLYNNHKLYFAADDGIHGRELWIWDFDFNCQESITITNPISQDTDVIVDKSITGSNKINSGIKVTYNANKSIALNPGFEAQIGSRFATSMEGCINIGISLSSAANSPATTNQTTNTGEPIFKNFSTKADAKPGIIQLLNDALNVELRLAYEAERNKNNEQKIAWVFDESSNQYILKMRVDGKEYVGYLAK